ncbi:hypothetical protein CP967_18040 [Streptomyces nitrosporeus]|uniref:DUF2637 domain-containing protein n=1 Tax=Streptomyces nitrosporeus TaxID=28894 RepID=A0A5J6FAT7_9ACTN|nr:hypothetical protein CP967_18040 [Streptomyces nitrosporeus]GGZ12368.1 hypothetical protein GCM10010327_49240 [Streptomyces nitrosporeus]
MIFPLEPLSLLAIGTLLLAAALLFAGWRMWRGRSRTSGMRTGTPAIKVAGLAAAGCTAYSADTSWRFAADYLDMGSTVERAFMFATAELALFATALMARQNLNGPARAPGVPGVLVWVITGVQIIPAYAEFGLVGGTVRAFVGPVMAAMLWHLAMGIELRHRTPQAASRGLTAVLVRQTRERLLARLGIADQDADAARLIRERALSDAVALILRAESMTDGQRGTLRGRRLSHRLHEALERADVDGDPLQDELLLRKLATRKQALDLASLTLPPRWHAPVPNAAGGSGQSRPRAGSPKRAKATGGLPASDSGDEDTHRAARPQSARPQPGTRLRPSAERPQRPVPAPVSPEPKSGDGPGADPGKTTKPKQPGRKPELPWDVLVAYAHRVHQETGRLSRDRLEDAVRADGHSIASDRAAEVTRAVKAELKTARADHPH